MTMTQVRAFVPASRAGEPLPVLPPPRPPRRLPQSMIARAPLSPAQLLTQSISAIVAALLFGFVLNLLVLSHVQHFVAQQQIGNSFREQLAAGTAPVSEGDFAGVLLADGAPVAVLQIPEIGVNEVVVEGTAGVQLMSGPGHKRDSVLPGQVGVSVIMARAAAYGGPFSRIQELAPGDRFTVVTGQGKQTFAVIGVRYAGDLAPPPPGDGVGRLVLETARGGPYVPVGIAKVDAQLVGQAEPAGARMTTAGTLPLEQKSLATDTRTIWALAFALQFFVVAELAAVWTYRKIGAQKMWIVFLPVLLLAGILVADQVNRLLPNLL